MVTFLKFGFLNNLYGNCTHFNNNCLGFFSSDHLDNSLIIMT